MTNITVDELKKMLEKYSGDTIIMCGFEGLKFYKPVGEGKHDYIGVIDFDNEKRRTQRVFNESGVIEPPKA